MAFEALNHVVGVRDEVGDFGHNEAVGLDLGVEIAGEVGHVLQAGQEIAGEDVEIGLSGANSDVCRAEGVLQLQVHVGGQ